MNCSRKIAALIAPAVLLLASTYPTAHVQAATKTVALTFDDGPYGTSTEQVLHILKKEKVHATFFLIGQNVARYPEETKQIVADGDTIGNHTYTHPNLSTLTKGEALGNIARAEQEIASTTGQHPLLFRPPYGILPLDLRKDLVAQGYHIVLWNDDPRDWDFASSTKDVIIARVFTQAQKKKHVVIIFHDGRDTHIDYPRSNLIAALPIIIEGLKKQGYRFVMATGT